MLKETIEARGQVRFVLTDEHGNVKIQEDHNLVVNAGLSFIARRMRDSAVPPISHMAVGTGTAAAAAANTALGAQSARVALTSNTSVTTNVTNDAVQYVATFGPGVGTAALTEAGLFNDATAGDMLARTVFPVINKGPLDTLSITWVVTII